MSRRAPITFATVGTLLFLYGLHATVGELPPDPRVLLVPLIIPALGVFITLPLWVGALRETMVRQQWWWFAFLLACLPAMPITVLVYNVGAPEAVNRSALNR